MVTNHLMNKVTSKVVMTLMGYATDELDPKDYVDAHLFYDLVFARNTTPTPLSGSRYMSAI